MDETDIAQVRQGQKVSVRLDAYPDLPWVRVMYAYPSHVTQGFLEAIAERPRICRYFDMPLQHTHPDVLRRMRRQ